MKIPKSFLEEAAKNSLDGGVESLIFDYSGRNMYGRECFGFRGSLQDLCFFMVTAYDLHEVFVKQYGQYNENSNYGYKLARAVLSDSMGLEKIFYFPGIELIDD